MAYSPPAGRSGPDRYDVIALGSSAGGITALGHVLGGLPADLPVPVLLVQHLDPRHKTLIAHVLGRRTGLTVKLAEHDDRIAAGVVYVAPPDRHLLVDRGGILSLTSAEMMNFVRPSVDLLFGSVAEAYGPTAIGCILTGTGSDGAMGASAIKDRGGTVIVEDPESAQFDGMPRAALQASAADFVLPVREIAAVLCRLVKAGRSW